MFSILKERENRAKSTRHLYHVATSSEYFLQRLKLEKKLKVHDGCVNTISWNEAGTLLLSGSDDQHLAITDPFSKKKVIKFRSGHRSNIFSAKFLPGSMDREVVSCSGSGEIFYTDVDREDTYGTNRFDCHFGTTYKLLVVPNEAATFLSCGDDGTVRFFDLRTKTSCSKFNCKEDVVIHLKNSVTALAADPIIPFHLAVASSDGIVRLYDRRMLKTKETGANSESLISKFPPPMTTGEKRFYRITSLNYRPGSHDVLVNYSSEHIYLFNSYELNKQQNYSSQVGIKNSGSMAGCSKEVELDPSNSSSGAVGPQDPGLDNETALKPIKRLRLRGDWSDTGPDARPESEEPALTNTIMQRMSDLLTRMLNNRNETGENQEGNEDMTAANDSAEDVMIEESIELNPIDTDVHAVHSVVIASAATLTAPEPQGRLLTQHSFSSEDQLSLELSFQEMDQFMTTAREDVSVFSQEVDLSSHDNSLTIVNWEDDSNSEQTIIVEKMNHCNYPVFGPSGVSHFQDEPSTSRADKSHVSLDNEFSFSNMVDVTSKNPFSDIRLPPRQVHATMDLSHGATPSVFDFSSEGSKSISDQISDSPHIVQGQSSDVVNQPNEITGSWTRTITDLNSELMSSSSLSTPPANLVYQLETSFVQPHALNLNIFRLKNKQMWTSHTIVSPTATSTISPRKTSSDITALSYSPSQFNSPAAIADRDLSGYEGNLSQQTQNDVSAIVSMSSLISSQPTSITEITPTAVLSNNGAKNQPIAGASTSSFIMDLNSADSVQSLASPKSGSFALNCPVNSPLSGNNSRASISEISAMISQNNQGLGSLSNICRSCGSYIKVQREDLDSSSLKDLSMTGLLCYQCYCFQQDSLSKAIEHKEEIKIEFNLEQSTSNQEEDQIKSIKPSIESPEQSNSQAFAKKLSKGKGKGKSSLKAQKASNIAEKFAPYNSGKMRISPVSSDEPQCYQIIPSSSTETSIFSNLTPNSDLASGQFPSQYEIKESTRTSISRQTVHFQEKDSTLDDEDDCPPQALYRLPSYKSCPQGFERHRRVGYSLPPTGSFQLHSDDEIDDVNDDSEAEYSDEDSRVKLRLKSDKQDLTKAAKKIQEIYRRKREAKEMAKMMETPQPKMLMKYSGHRNCRTMIKEANFYGDKYVISGSDCGRILAWERETGKMVMYLDADRHVVNCVQPNLYVPVIASSGIDYDIKIWSPSEVDSQFDQNKAEMVIHRNELMLEETRDTVTVPAAFMLRILASLSQIRTGRNSGRGQHAPDH